MTAVLESVSGQQHKPAALYARETPSTHFTGGWVGLGAVYTGAENLVTTGIRSPDRPARSSVVKPTEISGPYTHIYFTLVITC